MCTVAKTRLRTQMGDMKVGFLQISSIQNKYMQDLNKMLFANFRLNPEEKEASEIFREIRVILERLAAEAEGGRKFTYDEISLILEHYGDPTFTKNTLVDALQMLSEVFAHAHRRSPYSFESELKGRLQSPLTPQMEAVINHILLEPRLYNWIKTTSV